MRQTVQCKRSCSQELRGQGRKKRRIQNGRTQKNTIRIYNSLYKHSNITNYKGILAQQQQQEDVDLQLQDIGSDYTQVCTQIESSRKRQKEMVDKKEAQHGPQIRQLKSTIDGLVKQLAKEKSQFTNQQEILTQDEATLQEVEEKSQSIVEEVLQQKLSKAKEEADVAQKSHNEGVKQLEELKKQLQVLEGGSDNQAGDGNRAIKAQITQVLNQQTGLQHEISVNEMQIQQMQQNMGQVPVNEEDG
eukprot:TRINITY_DN14227_c0_g1_i2.p2 TRINITY_DN14227_c0_g1~~TRINITY_DN14227_c0_g1_i2.p2  ORF type:complete len:246 (+),score=38.29 TRINITY_DN14227_c0_g1_i2:193-930(+)